MLDFGSRRRVSDVHFQRLIDAAPDPLALLDHEGRIQAANPALAQLVGPSLPLRPGVHVATLIAPAARPGLAEHLAAAVARAPVLSPLRAAPIATTVADAEWELACRAIACVTRGPATLLLRVSDRTEAKRAEARLRESSRLETVGRLAGGIAHDFNNLLTAILGAAEAAAASPDHAAAELRQIEDAAHRGAGLVGQLLAFARQQVLRPTVLDLNVAVEKIRPLLQRLVGPTIDIQLALEQPGRLVRVDATQLDQVIMNLAANARNAMPDGGVLRIGTGHAVILDAQGPLPAGRYAVLELADSGCGMTPAVQARIFEPFYTTRPERGGTGLGLATVQGIVAQHGGHIAVDSVVGRGTRFRLHLPRHEGPADTAPAVQSGVAPDLLAPILLVEDEAPLRRLARTILERAGHAVRVAEDAEAALAMLVGDFSPSALISDVAMPGLDGVALAQRLRRRWPRLPVLLTSGYAPAACAADFAGDRMEFLQKPYAPVQLRQAVAALLGQPPPP